METAEKQKSCEERVREHCQGRMADLRLMWDAYCNGDEDGPKDTGPIHEYGLCFDYVAPGTFGDDQAEGYFRYQLSWGGPSDEFRIYANPDYSAHRVEYWFMDWFDGAPLTLAGDDRAWFLDFWDCYFAETGGAAAAHAAAME